MLTGRNDELAGELRDVDRLAKRLQADKNSVVTLADKDLFEAKAEIRGSTREIKDLEVEVEQLRQVMLDMNRGPGRCFTKILS